MVIQGVLGYFFFIYAFDNPDYEHCFAEDKKAYPVRTDFGNENH